MQDWQFQIIDCAQNEGQLRQRESFWQFKLKTFLPIGLNERSVSTYLCVFGKLLAMLLSSLFIAHFIVCI